MDLAALARKFPRLWHATFPGGWDSIQKSGLLPAKDLLGRSEGEAAATVRSEILTITSTVGREVMIRDQKPGRTNVAPYLDGVTPAEWWDLLNRRVYLFPSEAPLQRLLRSYADRGYGQEVITFRTEKLLGPVLDRVEVADVNAGVFPRSSARTRGIGTFSPLAAAAYPVSKVKEITVVGHLPVTEAAIVKVVAHAPNGDTRRLWP